jgi:hypothetical protein
MHLRGSEVMLWSEMQFKQNATLSWNDISGTKTDNYQGKMQELYKMARGIDRWSASYQSDMDLNEFGINCAYAYILYKAANQNALNALVLGPDTIRQRGAIISGFGITSVTPYQGTVDNQTKENHNKSHASTTQGSVLSEKYWWTFLNDSWLLGGIHSNSMFYLHIPGEVQELNDVKIWDDGNKRPRMLGRELIALHALGYKRVLVDDSSWGTPETERPGWENRQLKLANSLGYAFAPVDRTLTQAATFSDIFKAVPNYDSAESIKELLKGQNAVEYQSVESDISYIATDIIYGFQEGFAGSTQIRTEIASGAKLQVVRNAARSDGYNDYVRVKVSGANVKMMATGHTTLFYTNWSGVLYIDSQIFSSNSYVVSLY